MESPRSWMEHEEDGLSECTCEFPRSHVNPCSILLSCGIQSLSRRTLTSTLPGVLTAAMAALWTR